MSYPLTFQPIFKERLWGGRTLERLYQKPLPANLPIGESWEISDRPGDVSVVDRGPMAGRDLHALLERDGREMLGNARTVRGRFPLLVKILDAQETLSLQVHPSPQAALGLEGEPKTEVWYVAEAEPGAEIYAGLKRGVTRSEFEDRLRSGGVADCFHRLKVRRGDVMFVPSGRVHGIGAGCVIFEIQENSDTTYRVFDWNRVGPDGKARELHIPQSLASIDFDDFEPSLTASCRTEDRAASRPLVRHGLFDMDWRRIEPGERTELDAGRARIVAVTAGHARVEHPEWPVELGPGQFCLIPAALPGLQIEPLGEAAAEFLVAWPN